MRRHRDEPAGRRLPPGLPPVADVLTLDGTEAERRFLERLRREGVIGDHALRTGLGGLAMLERSLGLKARQAAREARRTR